MASVRFDDDQIRRIPILLDRAEELVGDHFAVPSFQESRYAYDVSTLDDLRPEEVPTAPALAQLVRYSRFPDKRRLSRFHRICLHDTRILECHRRERIELDAVLLVVLAHELIHLVRFTLRETTFHVATSQRQEEEDEVDRLTRGLLGTYPDPGVGRAVRIVTGG